MSDLPGIQIVNSVLCPYCEFNMIAIDRCSDCFSNGDASTAVGFCQTCRGHGNVAWCMDCLFQRPVTEYEKKNAYGEGETGAQQS